MKAIARDAAVDHVVDLAERPEPVVRSSDVLIRVGAPSLNRSTDKTRKRHVESVLPLRPRHVLGATLRV